MEIITFSDYIINKWSKEFYFESLKHMLQYRITLEEYFKDSYYEYKIIYLN